MKSTAYIAIFLLLAASASAAPSDSQTLNTIEDGNAVEETTPVRSLSALASTTTNPTEPPVPDSQVLWHYQIPDGGPQRLNAALGYNEQYAWSGGYFGGGKLFEMAGSGTPEWEFDRDGSFATAASQSGDIFYGAWEHNGAFEVYQFAAGNSTPVWTWDGAAAGYQPGNIQYPGMAACSDDGSVFVVGGNDGDSLAVMIFSAGSSTPLIFEDESLAYNPRQLRLTADGGKVILRAAATLYRIDTATATLEATYDLGASTDCFGVSADGSVVVFGFSGFQVIEWDGADYQLQFTGYCPGSNYAGLGWVGDDNEQIIVVWYAANYLKNWVTRFEKSQGNTPVWTYETPEAGGAYQDTPEWIDASADDEWIAIAFAGSQTDTNDEVIILRDSDPVGPWWGLNTPGSATCVDISDDGRYLVTSGKGVHLNQMGSGGDVYAVEIDQTVGLADGDFRARSVDEGVLLEWTVEGAVRVELTRDDARLADGLDGESAYLDRDPGSEPRSYLLIAYDADGEAAVFGPLEVLPAAVTGRTTLERPFPNPSEGSVSAVYELAAEAEVELALYDLAGRRVRLLEVGRRAAGRHAVEIDTAGLSAGVYLLRLSTPDGEAQRRLVVER